MPIHVELRFYTPTEKEIAEAVARASAPQPVKEPETIWTQSAVGWDEPETSWTQSAVGWDIGIHDRNPGPVQDRDAQDVVALAPMPQAHSQQKRGETWQVFFARREEMETPHQEKGTCL
jgi:hypothetical protein